MEIFIGFIKDWNFLLIGKSQKDEKYKSDIVNTNKSKS